MNEQTETMEHRQVKENNALAASSYPEARTSSSISPQAGCGTCGSSGGTTARVRMVL